MSDLLIHENSQAPITAIQTCVPEVIFVGQGPLLRIYRRSDTEVLFQSRIFAKQAIHGIAVSKSVEDDTTLAVILWGGRHVAYCNLDDQNSKKQNSRFTLCDDRVYRTHYRDWIYDVHFVQQASQVFDSSVRAVFISAENELGSLIFTNEGRTNESSLRCSRIFAGPKCGLYTAKMKRIDEKQLLIASGTAFGEIVIWSLTWAEHVVSASQHYIFTGHEGSVFGVCISNVISNPYLEKKRLLASCSDDRTIRIWDITDLSQGTPLDTHALQQDASSRERTTGFLNYVSDEAAATSRRLSIATAMGHISRIWDVRFAIERQLEAHDGYISTIYSVGEDATVQKWELQHSCSHDAAFKLSHIDTSHCHNGKNIWAFDVGGVDPTDPIVSGGADGKIVDHMATFDPRRPLLQDREWQISEVHAAVKTAINGSQEMHEPYEGTAPPKQPRTERSMQDSFRSFQFVNEHQLLMSTNQGTILLATHSGAGSYSWKQIAAFEGLKGYSVSSRLDAEPFEYIFFGGGSGHIYYYHSFFEEVHPLTQVEGKITNIFAELFPRGTHEYMSILVTCQQNRPPTHLRVSLGTGGTLRVTSTDVVESREDTGTTVTSSVLMVHDGIDKALVLGCRDGSIRSHTLRNAGSSRRFDYDQLQVHGNEAVTAMIWKPDQSLPRSIDDYNDPPLGLLFSVGRDGTLAVHKVSNGYYRRPVLVHRLLLSFGPSLEGLSIDPGTSDISVWGFTSKYFVCQNVSAAQDVVQIPCGGSHRVWAFHPTKHCNGGNFAWVKAMKLGMARREKADHEVIQSGGHGREIKTCAISSESLCADLGPLVATGSEDTNILLSYYVDWHGPQKQLKPLTVLRKHVTGVHSLQWSPAGDFLFSCGGFEEFYVWHLRQVSHLAVGVVCESRCPLDKSKSEMRIMDFSVRQVAVQEAMVSDEEPSWTFIISMVYSDSTIKIWKYTSDPDPYPDRSPWSLIATTHYTTSSLTTASFLGIDTTIWPLVTGSTDGSLQFWTLTDRTRELVSLGRQSIHQNSIKCMHVEALSHDMKVVFTGGDDNALGITVLVQDSNVDTDANADIWKSTSLLIPRAHAASINALSILRKTLNAVQKTGKIEMDVLSASNDQMVRAWHVTVDMRVPSVKGVQIRRGKKWSSAVADISSMGMLKAGGMGFEDAGSRKHLVVCGVGTEVWRVG